MSHKASELIAALEQGKTLINESLSLRVKAHSFHEGGFFLRNHKNTDFEMEWLIHLVVMYPQAYTIE